MAGSDNKLHCLSPVCEKKREIRGLCHACYNMASRLVKSGQITWHILESQGKCIRAGKAGRPRAATTAWLMDAQKTL